MNKGFTLIELLIVIAIIGILATLVLVSIGLPKNKEAYEQCKREKIEFYQKDGQLIGNSRMSDIETHCSYVTWD